MIIYLIMIFALLVGILVIVLGAEKGSAGMKGIGIILFIIAGACVLSFGLTVLNEHTNINDKKEQLMIEYEAVVRQLNDDINFGIDVIEFNETILDSREGYKNPWTSWFYGSYWLYIDPVPLPINAEKYGSTEMSIA